MSGTIVTLVVDPSDRRVYTDSVIGCGCSDLIFTNSPSPT